MAKKKREHVVFDQMLRVRKNIPISKVNSEGGRKQKSTQDLKRK